MRGMITGVLLGASIFVIGCGNDPPPPTAETNPVAQVDTQNFYANGEFKIGSDLAAGEYIAIGTGYVEVSRSTDDGKRQIIVNANLEGTRCYFDVQDGEYVKVMQDVKLYPSANAPAIEVGDSLPSGHYKIGKDAKAGEYKITLEQGGYFEVTTNTRHAGNYIVKNQFTNEGGSFYATVLDGQYLLIRKGTGQFVGAPKPKASPPAPAPPPKVLNLGLTLEQFKQKYRENALAMSGQNFNIDNAQLKIGDVQDVFQSNISENVVVMGAIDKSSGLLKETWVLCSPEAILDGAIAYGLIISIVNPELTADQRGELMSELKLPDRLEELFHTEGRAVRGNVRYMTGYIPRGGFMFTASAKDL